MITHNICFCEEKNDLVDTHAYFEMVKIHDFFRWTWKTGQTVLVQAVYLS